MIISCLHFQAKVITGRIGVDGNALDKPQATPNTRGYSFVGTPTATPFMDGSESPLMTWGELEGTPFRLDGSDTPLHSGPSFRITETSRRENIALELAEKAGKRMREQKTKALEAAKQNINTPHIRSSLDRLAVMSPAARRLASSSLKMKESLLSPSPLTTPSRTPIFGTKPLTPSPLVRKKAPAASKSKPKERPAAADFF